jgi:hypothetical protein
MWQAKAERKNSLTESVEIFVVRLVDVLKVQYATVEMQLSK